MSSDSLVTFDDLLRLIDTADAAEVQRQLRALRVSELLAIRESGPQFPFLRSHPSKDELIRHLLSEVGRWQRVALPRPTPEQVAVSVMTAYGITAQVARRTAGELIERVSEAIHES